MVVLWVWILLHKLRCVRNVTILYILEIKLNPTSSHSPIRPGKKPVSIIIMAPTAPKGPAEVPGGLLSQCQHLGHQSSRWDAYILNQHDPLIRNHRAEPTCVSPLSCHIGHRIPVLEPCLQSDGMWQWGSFFCRWHGAQASHKVEGGPGTSHQTSSVVEEQRRAHMHLTELPVTHTGTGSWDGAWH